MDRYNFNDISFPATALDLQVFQQNNKDVAINALYYIKAANRKPARVTPLYHPPLSVVTGRRMVNILLVNDHWMPVTSLSRLLGTRTERGIGQHNAYCYRCLRNLYHQDRLEQHMKRCYMTMGQQEIMPRAEDARMQFNDWSHMLSPPFVMYADMEALLVPPDVANNKILQTHVPCAVGSYIVPHESLNLPNQQVVIQQGEHCVREFCEYLDWKVRQIYQYNRDHCNKPQQRNDQAQVQRFNAAVECEYCDTPFSEAVPKVWHHCHISGRLLATVCQRCNTRIRQPTAVLPVLVHNLKNYDMHAFCLDGFANMPGWRLKPIAQTKEKYITLTAQTEVDKDESGRPIYFTIRFVDSCQIVTGSLDRLVSSLGTDSIVHARRMRERFVQADDDVMFKKGVFPYSYLDNWNKLNDAALPPLPAFFDTLTNSLRTTEEEYQRAQRAWQQFNCQKFEDYMLRYLELDCRLLADVFENFRNNTIQQFELRSG